MLQEASGSRSGWSGTTDCRLANVGWPAAEFTGVLGCRMAVAARDPESMDTVDWIDRYYRQGRHRLRRV